MQPRSFAAAGAVVALVVALAALAADGPSFFPLTPAQDDFQPNALDASAYVEAPTGRHGFVTAKGDGFVFNDGTPIRFFGAQMNTLPKDRVDYTVRRMRRQGINITRLHGLEFLNDRNAKTSFEYSPDAWDRLDYLIAKLGENGIYLILDVDYPLNYRFRSGDEIPNLPNGGPAPYAEFIEPKVAAVLHRRMRDVFTHVNPYTKKRYADDPTLAAVEILNEDSLFWGTIPEPWRGQLERRFSEFRGEPSTLLRNWDFVERAADRKKIGQDQLRFFHQLEDAYWQASYKVLRDAGVKVPISGTNWQGHGFPTRVHMLTQSRLDYIDRHGYWDHPQGDGNLKWQIATAQFHNLPMVKAVSPDQDTIAYLGVGNLVTEKAWEQVLGRPMTISEWNTCLPNQHSLEGTPLMTAYGLLQGWDGSLQFGYFSPDFTDRLGRGSFDLFGNPPQILQFPAAAVMWHRGDVREAPVVSESIYDAESVFDWKEDRKPVPLAAALVGKVGYRFVDRARRPGVPDLGKYWDPAKLTARSVTGELSWDARNGVVHVDTPRSQVVVGFLSSQTHVLGDVRLTASNAFGAVWVTAMSGAAPIRSAARLLVTAVGPGRSPGMEYEKTGATGRLGALWHLKSPGDGAALVEGVAGELRIRHDGAKRPAAWTLDVTGRRRDRIDVATDGGDVVLKMAPEHRTVYYELIWE